jgi:hypothetical protein
MQRRGWIASLVLAALAGALALASFWPRGGAVASAAVATAQAPARHCATHPKATLRALREGGQRLAVVVKAFEPPKSHNGRLAVWLVDAGGKRMSLASFAVHPLRAFTSAEPGRSQRFMVSLSEVGHLVEDGKPLCVEVGFDASGGAPQGGSAEIEIELVPAPGK